MKRKWIGYEDLTTGPYMWCGRVQLFLFRKAWRTGGLSFDADGVFAICTPWFLFYPW